MTAGSSLLAVLLAAAGGVVYHVSAKSLPRDAAPTLVLIAAYVTALGISAVAHLSLSSTGTAAPSRLFHPGIVGMGLGAAMLELGYVLTYRAALPVSSASVLVNSLVTLVLIPIGLLAFAEDLPAVKAAGILLCIAGVWLLR